MKSEMIRVVADKNIPFLKGVLEPYCDVMYLSGEEISHEACSEADALLVRTRTKCNASLLEGTPVRFIATATIGTDHIDKEYLAQSGIALSSAPGCNACGVMQYVFTALSHISRKKGICLRGKSLGVIGAGNTGERVARMGEMMGMRVLRNDPPKSLCSATPRIYAALERVLEESDIVSCHLPLDENTIGLLDTEALSKMKDGAIFINASRGEVVADQALKEHIPRLGAVVLDVWRGEPANIDRALVGMADIATPHIAGYSFEGKVNGTAMTVGSFASFFGIGDLADYTPQHRPLQKVDFSSMLESGILEEIFPIMETDALFREDPAAFERIRNNYDYRHEFYVPERISKLL